MNIANNLVAIEEIKSDILGEVADLYKKLADYDELWKARLRPLSQWIIFLQDILGLHTALSIQEYAICLKWQKRIHIL